MSASPSVPLGSVIIAAARGICSKQESEHVTFSAQTLRWPPFPLLKWRPSLLSHPALQTVRPHLPLPHARDIPLRLCCHLALPSDTPGLCTGCFLSLRVLPSLTPTTPSLISTSLFTCHLLSESHSDGPILNCNPAPFPGPLRGSTSPLSHTGCVYFLLSIPICQTTSAWTGILICSVC